MRDTRETMGGWSHGYVTDTIYTEGSYREMSPSWLNHVAAFHGCVPRDLEKPFVYIELGCGLGRTAAHMAAAFPQGEFIAVDFNPAHIDSARRYAADLGLSNVRYIEEGFEDLVGDENARRLDLPSADFIALHGVYSWIDRPAQIAVQRFILERLKSGGIVYNSYNCLPGWGMEAPLRQLMIEYGKERAGTSTEKLGSALTVMGEMSQHGGYFASNPQIRKAVENFRSRAPNYFVHEMMNAAWNLQYSSALADDMAAAKLDFLGSATLVENHPELLLDAGAAAFVLGQRGSRLRQLSQDYLTNARFRRDIFVRGHAQLTGHKARRVLETQSLVALRSLIGADSKVQFGANNITIDIDVMHEIGRLFESGTATIGDLAKTIGPDNFFARYFGVVRVLLAGGALVPAASSLRVATKFGDQATISINGAPNKKLLKMATTFNGTEQLARHLVSPVTGSIVAIGPVSATILKSLITTHRLDLAVDSAIRAFDENGLSVRHNDTLVTERAERVHRVREMAENFVAQELPILQRAGCVHVV